MLRTRGQAVSGRTFRKKEARTCQPRMKSVGECLRFTLNMTVTDLDEYLDEWLQAERELREKYNRSNEEGAKEK
jgi:hypothetical protein